MKKLLVLGALAVASAGLTVPAHAQGVYLGFGNGPSYYGSGGYDEDYRRYRPRYSYGSYAQDYRHCRVVRVWTGDHYRRIRRCW